MGDSSIPDISCVQEIQSLIEKLEPLNSRFNEYISMLDGLGAYDPSVSKQTIADMNKKDKLIYQEIMEIINEAGKIDTRIQGIYDRAKKAINSVTDSTVKDIDLTDPLYGGCKVSVKDAKTVLDTMMSLKYQAESIVNNIFMKYDDILVTQFPGIFAPVPRGIDDHCIKDDAHNARKMIYDKVYAPLTKVVDALRGEDETDSHYNARKWIRDHGLLVHASNTFQEFVDDVYSADVEENTLQELVNDMLSADVEGNVYKLNNIANHCYKSLTPDEYDWVLREISLKKEQSKVNVYKITDKSIHFERVARFICRLLFAYEYVSGQGYSAYITDTNKNIIDAFTVEDMQLLMAIPETCLFVFPTDKDSEYIHTIDPAVIEHVIKGNTNWDLDSAIMYWFWSYIKGKKYEPYTDTQGQVHPVPDKTPEPKDYFNEVFKPKLKRLMSVMANKLLSGDGVMGNKDAVSLMAPWICSIFDNTNGLELTFTNRNIYIETNIIERAKKFTDVGEFITWFHDAVIVKVPKLVWKSFNAISGTELLRKVPIKFVPNNYTLFCKEYEYETAILTALNSVYWLYGYPTDNAGDYLKGASLTVAQDAYTRQGGLCYALGSDPVKISTEVYDPFKVIWDPQPIKSVAYTIRGEPPVDWTMQAINDTWFFKWTSVQYSFMVQHLGSVIRPIDVKDQIPFIGAKCVMLPYKTYIMDTVVKRYENSDGCPYKGIEYNKNPWLFTYADYIAGPYVKGHTFIDIIFNGTVKRLLKSRITFPYNNILDMSFINRAHFNWKGSGASWSNVVLPFYILNKSPMEKDTFEKKQVQAEYKSEQITIPTLPNISSKDVEFIMHQCGTSGLGKIDCNEKP